MLLLLCRFVCYRSIGYLRVPRETRGTKFWTLPHTIINQCDVLTGYVNHAPLFFLLLLLLLLVCVCVCFSDGSDNSPWTIVSVYENNNSFRVKGVTFTKGDPVIVTSRVTGEEFHGEITVVKSKAVRFFFFFLSPWILIRRGAIFFLFFEYVWLNLWSWYFPLLKNFIHVCVVCV